MVKYVLRFVTQAEKYVNYSSRKALIPGNAGQLLQRNKRVRLDRLISTEKKFNS